MLCSTSQSGLGCLLRAFILSTRLLYLSPRSSAGQYPLPLWHDGVVNHILAPRCGESVVRALHKLQMSVKILFHQQVSFDLIERTSLSYLLLSCV
jgi:hypothetical protein